MIVAGIVYWARKNLVERIIWHSFCFPDCEKLSWNNHLFGVVVLAAIIQRFWGSIEQPRITKRSLRASFWFSYQCSDFAGSLVSWSGYSKPKQSGTFRDPQLCDSEWAAIDRDMCFTFGWSNQRDVWFWRGSWRVMFRQRDLNVVSAGIWCINRAPYLSQQTEPVNPELISRDFFVKPLRYGFFSHESCVLDLIASFLAELGRI